MALEGTMVKLDSATVTNAGGQSSIVFDNILQTYDDLVLRVSLRSSNTQDYINLQFNGSTSNFTSRWILGNGASATGATRSDSLHSATLNPSNWTTGTFSNAEIYIPSYRNNTNKSFSIDTVTENNATTAYAEIIAGLWSNVAAITSITLIPGDGTGVFAQHSTATLYGISRTTVRATGGMITEDANFIYHTFRSSGTFTPNRALSCDVLVLGGGGGASGGVNGVNFGSGSASGILRSSNSVSMGSGVSFTVTVGGGGTGAIGTGAAGTSSVVSGTGITTITATAGNGIGTGRTGASNADFSGGTGVNGFEGGGGAGTAGSGSGPTGGAASTAFSTWLSATGTGVNGAIGGGGASQNGTTTGGGGTFGSGNGTANTGSGGAGGTSTSAGGNGGAGIVIIRYAK